MKQIVVDGIIMNWNPGSVALVLYWPYNAGGVLYWPADRPSSALIMTLSVEAPTLGSVRSTIILCCSWRGRSQDKLKSLGQRIIDAGIHNT